MQRPDNYRAWAPANETLLMQKCITQLHGTKRSQQVANPSHRLAPAMEGPNTLCRWAPKCVRSQSKSTRRKEGSINKHRNTAVHCLNTHTL